MEGGRGGTNTHLVSSVCLRGRGLAHCPEAFILPFLNSTITY